MAEQNPLKPLFADIAAAIREKDGSEGAIPAENFPERIRAIPAGGLSADVHTITLESSDPNGGNVSGGGKASEGMMVTVKADAPADGYKFAGWQENGAVVSAVAEYTFPVTADRALTAVFEVYTSKLPTGYMELEYVESTNGQYITIPKGVTSSRLIADIEPTKSATGQYEVFFGQYKYSTAVGTTYHTGLFRTSRGIHGGVGVNTGQLVTLSTDKSLRRMTFEIDSDNKRLILDGEITSISISSSSQNLDMAMNLPSEYRQTTSAVAFNYIPAKIYSFKGYDSSGNLTKEYIPCKNSSGVAGLYDSVAKEFYPSATSTEFIAGPDV